jgi:hypothetical protein
VELDKFYVSLLLCHNIVTPGQGKRVKCPRGPAAVNGDETRDGHWPGCEASFVKRDMSACSREIRFTIMLGRRGK